MKLNNFFTPNVRDGWFGSVFFLFIWASVVTGSQVGLKNQ